ncbi:MULTISPECIES: antibiotic biosynthesis monooxygenase [unclassified Microbulbifer]|uniref:antibiotic biosynthesis monooxygenase family protein n=1 Tax=unclassified Microbulbifer TaxID=2619833 RepID=UPI0027E55135|nr:MULTISPECIES: antibiotic biosynthesis monooxygenase [unclassified Microbulbifer]
MSNHDSSSANLAVQSPYILVNRFVPKPGMMDRFITLQMAETEKMQDTAKQYGWLGNQLYRALDDSSVTVVTFFTSRSSQRQWADYPGFTDHLERIRPLLQQVDSVPCALAASYGDELPV